MAYLQLGQSATASVQWVDASGNPVKSVGQPTWQSSDPAMLSCDASTAQGKADIRGLQVGHVALHVTATFRSGNDTYPVNIAMDIDIIDRVVAEGEINLSYGAIGPIHRL